MLKAVGTAITLYFLMLSIGTAATGNPDDIQHRQALTLAKAGRYTQAIVLLRPLVDKYPKPNRFFYDYLQILAWQGRYDQVTHYAKVIPLNIAPPYVLITLAFSYRQQKDFKHAASVYTQLITRYPSVEQYKINLALIYIDQKQFKLAKRLLQPLYDRMHPNLAVLNALAYLYERQLQWLPALAIYDEILALNPADKGIYKKKVMALNRLGASHLAYDLIQDPSLFTKEELARIRADRAAHQLRWSMIPKDNPAQRFTETDQAIDAIEKNLAWNRRQLGERHPLTLNSQYDLLLALRNRYRMKEVLAHNAALVEANIPIPGYAKNAVCDAWLYEQHPQQAMTCYQQVIRSGYDNLNAKLGLYYAYLENEDYPKAQQWISRLAKAQRAFIKGKGKKKIIKPNFKKLQTETVKALGLAFADDLDAAQTRFAWMNQHAPFNLDLRQELANIDYWRGWPRKAQEEYEIGLHQSPKHLGLRLGQARNWLELKEYQKAEQAILTLYKMYPEDKGIAKQKRLWDIHNMREFITQVNRNSSSGGTKGSKGLAIESTLFSAPMAYHYRLFLHHRYSDATFAEGNGLLNQAGIGGEYRARDIRLTGELYKSHYANNRLGIAITGAYAFDDYLSSYFSVQSVSDETPLRALRQGVTAKSVRAGFDYRWHESRSVGLNLAYLDFSDHNQRKSLSGFWKERWYAQYNYKFSTRLDVYHSINSKKDRIYFNPSRDSAMSMAVENDWLTWRRYDNSFHQRLILSTGRYRQQGFSTGGLWSVQYEHRWKARHQMELSYGVKRAQARYDGKNEYTWDYYLTLDWKF